MTTRQNVIMIDGWEHIHCPVCGELVETYDICDTCHWQNTGPINNDGGPNYISLDEAKRRWAKGEPLRNFFKDQ